MITGVEILGAAAATAQLLETTFKVVVGIAELRDRMKEAPSRIRGLKDELVTLNNTIIRIRDNPRLQEPHVEVIIMTIGLKVNTLNGLLSKSSTEPNIPSLKKIVKALKVRQTEARIIQNFADLERDKTSLILTVNELFPKILDDTLDSNRPMANDPITPPQTPHNIPKAKNFPAMSQSQGISPGMSTTEYSNFSSAKIKGDGNWIGNSTGTEAKFEGADIVGNGNLMGHHQKDSYTAIAHSRIANTTAWSDWSWDACHCKWRRHRMSNGKNEYEWRDPEPSSMSTSNQGSTAAWSEWNWYEDRKLWGRYRLSMPNNEYEYEWRAQGQGS